MNLHPSINLESLVEDYVVSNTPEYLYKKLRSNLSVQWMAKNLQAQTIVEIYKEIQQKKVKSAEDIALAYGALVSLSFKDYSETQPVLESLPLEGFEWGAKIKELIISLVTPTLIITTTLPPLLKKLVPQFNADSSNQIVHWSGSPD